MPAFSALFCISMSVTALVCGIRILHVRYSGQLPEGLQRAYAIRLLFDADERPELTISEPRPEALKKKVAEKLSGYQSKCSV